MSENWKKLANSFTNPGTFRIPPEDFDSFWKIFLKGLYVLTIILLTISAIVYLYFPKTGLALIVLSLIYFFDLIRTNPNRKKNFYERWVKPKKIG